MSNLAHSCENDQKIMSENVCEIKQETDQCNDGPFNDGDEKIDSIQSAQRFLLDRLSSLKFQPKNVTDGNHQPTDLWTHHQLPEMARKILQLLSQTVSCDHSFEDDSDADEDDSEAWKNDKLETLTQFVRSFLDFNKDSFAINHNHWPGEYSHSDTSMTDGENEDENERINTRSTRRQQQQSTSKQATSSKPSLKQRAKNKNAKQTSPNLTTMNEKAMATNLSTDKFLIDCSSSLMLKLNSSQYDPTFPVMYGLAFNSFSYPDNVFAVCGQSLLIVYRCLTTIEQQSNRNGLQPLFAHTDSNDSYYCCCWSHDYQRPDHPYLCVGGERGVIRIIDVRRQCESKTLYGHGAAINDLKICPRDPSLLLSASKDSGIRLWNLATNTLIAIFGGVQGHRDEVLAIDFHRSRSLFVSVSIDHSIKIWSFRHHEVAQAIEKSRHFISDQNAQQFPTVSQHFPNYSTRDVHHNYIDSVQWFGDLLVTKSCDEKLIIWKPGASENETLDDLERRTYYSDSATHGTLDSSEDSTTSNVVIIRRFDLDRNNMWFVRFSLDLNEFILAIGNLQGHLFLYDLKHFNPRDYRLAFEVPVPIPTIVCSQKKNNNSLPQRAYSRVIRQTAFNEDGTILIVLGENSTVTRYDLLRVTKPMVRAYLGSLLNR